MDIEMQKTTAQKLADRRLQKMRQGQSSCEYVTLPSDPEIRFAVVPLTEAEYTQALEKTSTVVGDGLAGAQLQDRRRAQEILVRAIREEFDLSAHVFESVDDLLRVIEVNDTDELIDRYNEMTAQSSPALDGISEEEFRNLKELLQEMDWNVLSGRAWYAATRFLSTIMPSPLLDKSPGSSSTKPLITTND